MPPVLRRPAVGRPPLHHRAAPEPLALLPPVAIHDGLAAVGALAADLAEPAALGGAGPQEQVQAPGPEPAAADVAAAPVQLLEPVPEAGDAQTHGQRELIAYRVKLWLRIGLAFAWLLVAAVLLASLPWHAFLKSVGSLFGVVSAAADTSTAVLTAASNLTTAVATFSVDAVQGSRSVMHDFLKGIEFTDVKTKAYGNTVVGPSLDSLRVWVDNETDALMPPTLAKAWVLQLERMKTASLSSIELSHSSLDMKAGAFTYATGEARKLSRSKWGLRYVITAVSFKTSWTNPLWDFTGADVEGQFPAALQMLTQAVEQQPLMKLLGASPWDKEASWWR